MSDQHFSPFGLLSQKYHGLGDLNNKQVFLTVTELEVQDQGTGRLGSLLLGSEVADFSLCPHRVDGARPVSRALL